MSLKQPYYHHWDGRDIDRTNYLPEFEGKYNLYICKNGHHTISLDTDEGVTPMFLICRRKRSARTECGERADSRVYQLPDNWMRRFGPVRIIWRKPTDREVRVGSPEMLDHYKNGGLHLEWLTE